MYQDVFCVTKTMMKMQAFVAGGDNVPAFAKQCETVDKNGAIHYKHHDNDFVDCKPGDLIYYGGSRGENKYLSILDSSLYTVMNGEVYEKQPIYKCCMVSKELPDFLSDIDITWRKDHWFLNSSRLRIRVCLGDYWIRDIDPEQRYEVPVVSCIEPDGYSFDTFWRCDSNGALIEKLEDYHRRITSAPRF